MFVGSAYRSYIAKFNHFNEAGFGSAGVDRFFPSFSSFWLTRTRKVIAFHVTLRVNGNESLKWTNKCPTNLFLFGYSFIWTRFSCAASLLTVVGWCGCYLKWLMCGSIRYWWIQSQLLHFSTEFFLPFVIYFLCLGSRFHLWARDERWKILDFSLVILSLYHTSNAPSPSLSWYFFSLSLWSSMNNIQFINYPCFTHSEQAHERWKRNKPSALIPTQQQHQQQTWKRKNESWEIASDFEIHITLTWAEPSDSRWNEHEH